MILFIEAAEEVVSPDKLSAGSGSGWMGGAEEPPETKQKRAVSQHPSCKGSVFSKMLADETAPLCAPYLSRSSVPITECISVLFVELGTP